MVSLGCVYRPIRHNHLPKAQASLSIVLRGGNWFSLGCWASMPQTVSNLHIMYLVGGMGRKGNIFHQSFFRIIQL